MGARHDRQCAKCKKWEVEEIEDWISLYCPSCNDRLIEKSNEQRDWDYWHNRK